MQCEAREYWKVRRDYAGEPFFRLDKDKLNVDFGHEVSVALTLFLNAHYAFNDRDDPPSEEEKQHLIDVMSQAREVLGEINPYLFVDSLIALERKARVSASNRN